MWTLTIALALAAPAFAQDGQASPPAEEELPPLVKEPVLVEFAEAAYPEEAKVAGLEGVVRLAITIDESGAVTEAEVIEPAGHGFDAAALEAARQLRFEPAQDAEGPVPVIIEFTYGFVLDSGDLDEQQHAGQAQGPEELVPSALAPVNLVGVLLEMGTRRPLSGAPVRVTAGTFAAETTTDAEGRWSFRGVPLGGASVSAALPDYEPATATVAVVEGEVTELRLWIRNLAYKDNEIVGVYRKKTEDVTRRTLTVEEVRRVPGTFGDPVRVIQNLPGAARSPLGSGLLVIRGANPEDSAVYIDGIRIPLIYHLGGYVSVVNSDLIEAVDYLPGGYGVEYGRSLGGVVDVRTTTEYPERDRLVWSTDALDSGGLYEGKVGKNDGTGIAVAGRHSYIEFLVPYFSPNPDFTVKPRWWDYQLKVDRLAEDKDPLSFFLFGFQDTLIASSPAGTAQGTDQDTQGDLGTVYSTHRAYLKWEHPFSDTWRLRLVPSIGIDFGEFDLGDEFHLSQYQYTAEVRAEAVWSPSAHVDATAGLDFIGGYWDFSAELPLNPESFGDYDPIGEREPWVVEGFGNLWAPDAYLDARIRPLANPDRLVLTPGVRFNFLVADDFDNPDLMIPPMWSLDPRLAVRWNVTERGALKGGTGIYHQTPLPFEAWRPDGSVEIDYERAISYEIGWEQQVTDAVNADVALFYKHLDDLIVTNGDWGGLDDQFFTNQGVGRAYGTEIIVRHALVDRFFGWVSYTLSRSERNDYPDVDGEDGWYLFELDQTHILVAVAGYRLPRDVEVSGKIQYVTGNPYMPYSGGVYDVDQDYYWGYATGAYNSVRMPDYFAMDLRADKLFTFKRWQLEVYLDLLNVVRGTNPEFAVYNYDLTEQTWIRGLPFIPSPGFEARFEF